MLMSNACSFQKKMLSNLTDLLAVFWKFCKTCRNISIMEFTVKEVTVFRVANWTKCSAKYNFFEILRNIHYN